MFLDHLLGGSTIFLRCSLPETNKSHLKMVVSNRNLLFQGSFFQGRTVSFSEGIMFFFVFFLRGSRLFDR